MPFLLYVNLNMAIQAALELCFFEFFTAPEHAVWELAVVNGLKYQFFIECIGKAASGSSWRRRNRNVAEKMQSGKESPGQAAASGDFGAASSWAGASIC